MKVRLKISYTTTVTANVVVEVPDNFDTGQSEGIGKELFDENIIPRKVWNADDGEHEYLGTDVDYDVCDKPDYTVVQKITPSDEFKPLLFGPG